MIGAKPTFTSYGSVPYSPCIFCRGFSIQRLKQSEVFITTFKRSFECCDIANKYKTYCVKIFVVKTRGVFRTGEIAQSPKLSDFVRVLEKL